MQKQPKVVFDPTIAETMWRWVNEWPEKPVPINLDAMDKYGPSMMIQPLSGTVIRREYLTRSFLGDWPFAIYVRTNTGADEDRVGAFNTIAALWAWMQSEPLPDLGENKNSVKLEMTALPAISMRYEDGSEDYQALFALTYKEVHTCSQQS